MAFAKRTAVSRSISGGAHFYYREPWSRDRVCDLVRRVNAEAPRAFLADRSVLKEGDRPSSEDAWLYGSWEYVKLATDGSLPQEVAAHERALRGERGTSTTLFLAGGSSQDDSEERKLRFTSDLQVFVYPDLSLTEMDFCGTYTDWGNDEFIEKGGLEEEFQWASNVLDVIVRAFPPAWGRLGEHVPTPYTFPREAPAILDSRKLPSSRLWWINVFGPDYVEAFGREFLLGAPGYRREEVARNCILYRITRDFLIFGDPDPPPQEVEAYFRAHPNGRRTRYRPLLAEELIPRRYRAILQVRGGPGRPQRP